MTFLSRKFFITLGVVATVFSAAYGAQAYVIDSFQSVGGTGIRDVAHNYDVGMHSSTWRGSSILGGQRQITSNITAIDTPAGAPGAHMGVSNGILSLGNDQGVHSVLSILWGGLDNGGLGGFDATSAGTQGGIGFSVSTDKAGLQFDFSICSAGGNCSTYSFLSDGSDNQTFSLLFSEIADSTSGTGAAFGSIDSFSLTAFSPTNDDSWDIRVGQVGSIPPVSEPSMFVMLLVGVGLILYRRRQFMLRAV